MLQNLEEGAEVLSDIRNSDDCRSCLILSVCRRLGHDSVNAGPLAGDGAAAFSIKFRVSPCYEQSGDTSTASVGALPRNLHRHRTSEQWSRRNPRFGVRYRYWGLNNSNEMFSKPRRKSIGLPAVARTQLEPCRWGVSRRLRYHLGKNVSLLHVISRLYPYRSLSHVVRANYIRLPMIEGVLLPGVALSGAGNFVRRFCC